MRSTIHDPINWHIRRAANILRQGGIVAYPTEGVWGLGCDPDNQRSVQRLLTLKHRPWQKGLILIAGDFHQLDPYISLANTDTARRFTKTWPGPVTWLVPARKSVPLWLRGCHTTVAVRVTDHPTAAALCRLFGGALVSTSANLCGRPPCRTYLQVRRHFDGRLDYIVPGKTGDLMGPTEIRDSRTAAIVRRR